MATVDVPVSGRVARVIYSEKPDGKGGVYRNGTAVLMTEYGKVETELQTGSSDRVVQAFRSLDEGETVTLLVGFGSGDKWSSPPRAYFLEDLTSRK